MSVTCSASVKYMLGDDSVSTEVSTDGGLTRAQVTKPAPHLVTQPTPHSSICAQVRRVVEVLDPAVAARVYLSEVLIVLGRE